MGRPRKIGQRILGPYEIAPGRFEVRIVEGPDRHSSFYADEAEAEAAAEAMRGNLAQSVSSIGQALGEYEKFLRTRGHKRGPNRESSITQARIKLSAFFSDHERALNTLSRPVCQRYYDDFRSRTRTLKKRDADGWPIPKRDKKGKPLATIKKYRGARGERVVALYETEVVPISVAYHRNTLAQAKTFGAWCVKKGWLKANPLEGIEGEGRKKTGKPQPRIDEARRFVRKAVELITTEQDWGAFAALCDLILGTRNRDILERRVRDIDDDCGELVIEGAKTAKGNRRITIPEDLRPFFRLLMEGKKPHDLLFGSHDQGWVSDAAVRICRLAGLPRYTGHGLRGAQSTVATFSGSTAIAVTETLGHENFATTVESYLRPGTIETVAARTTAKRLFQKPQHDESDHTTTDTTRS